MNTKNFKFHGKGALKKNKIYRILKNSESIMTTSQIRDRYNQSDKHGITTHELAQLLTYTKEFKQVGYITTQNQIISADPSKHARALWRVY